VIKIQNEIIFFKKKKRKKDLNVKECCVVFMKYFFTQRNVSMSVCQKVALYLNVSLCAQTLSMTFARMITTAAFGDS
jgi:hypothetical protein